MSRVGRIFHFLHENQQGGFFFIYYLKNSSAVTSYQFQTHWPEKKSHSLRFVIVDVKLFLALKSVHGNCTLLYQEIFFSNVLSEHSLL